MTVTGEKALGMSQVTTTEQHQRFSCETPSFNELFGLSGKPTLGNFVSWLVANRLANK